MEIFGIGPLELILVFILALIFIGPGKMPEVAASLGKAIREFRAASAELTDALNAEIAEAERRKAVAAAENGSGHSEAEAVQAEIVAQGEAELQAPVEYAAVETETVAEPAEPAMPPVAEPTIDDVLAAIEAQEAEEARQREAEEEARRQAALLERQMRDGIAPLPAALLLPSTDAPLVVVNPTTSNSAEPAESEEASAEAELPGPNADEHASADEAALEVTGPMSPVADDGLSPVGDKADGDSAPAEDEALESSGARRTEVG